MPKLQRIAAVFSLILAVLCVAGCGEESPPLPDTEQSTQPQGPRIVTIAPALSQMLVDLGLGDSIVGVAEHDFAAPKGLPVVGNYNAVNTELLLSTQPTHVLMMTGPDGPPASVKRLAELGQFDLYTFPFPLSIQDIQKTLYDQSPDADPSLATSLGINEKAMQLKMRLLRQLAAISSLTAAEDAPSVLLVLGTDPVMASGPDTVHDELLGFAGGFNAAADATVTAPEYDREALIALAPQVILLLDPNSPDLAEGDARLAAFEGLPIPAIEHGRVYVLNDPLVLLPSTSIGSVCADMAKAIHPNLSKEIDQVLAEQDAPLP